MNACLRFIFNLRKDDYSQFYDRLNWLSTDDRRAFLILCFMYSNLQSPPYIASSLRPYVILVTLPTPLLVTLPSLSLGTLPFKVPFNVPPYGIFYPLLFMPSCLYMNSRVNYFVICDKLFLTILTFTQTDASFFSQSLLLSIK